MKRYYLRSVITLTVVGLFLLIVTTGSSASDVSCYKTESLGGEVRGIAIGDFDGDENVEVAVGTALEGFLFFFRPKMKDDSSRVEMDHLSEISFGSFIVGPTSGDIDGDGRPELVLVDNVNQLWGLDFDGKEVNAKFPPIQLADPAIRVEVIEILDGPSTSAKDPGGARRLSAVAVVGPVGLSLYAFSDTGEEVKAHYPLGFFAFCSCTGDIDGDGVKELLLGGSGGRLIALSFIRRGDGVLVVVKGGRDSPEIEGRVGEGFPKPGILSVRAVDTDEDGRSEVFAGDSDGYVTMFCFDGELAPVSSVKSGSGKAVSILTSLRGHVFAGDSLGFREIGIDKAGSGKMVLREGLKRDLGDYCTEIDALDFGSSAKGLAIIGCVDGLVVLPLLTP